VIIKRTKETAVAWDQLEVGIVARLFDVFGVVILVVFFYVGF
jgi:hypothetical protein